MTLSDTNAVADCTRGKALAFAAISCQSCIGPSPISMFCRNKMCGVKPNKRPFTSRSSPAYTAITTTSTKTPSITPISEISVNEDNIARRGLRYRLANRKLKDRRLMPSANAERASRQAIPATQ